MTTRPKVGTAAGAEPTNDPRYPIGKFVYGGAASVEDRERWIAEIAAAPARLRAMVAGLGDTQLDTPYRDGGWTVRQVVHHVPDSHMNAYIRTKLALTEDRPVIKPYDETLWGELADARTAPIEMSLVLLERLHERWLILLRSMRVEDFARTYRHPELGDKLLGLDHLLALYAWHGRHHTAQIESLLTQRGWKSGA